MVDLPRWRADLNATLEAYAALRLAGLSELAPQLAEARRFCEQRGGIGGARVFTRIWLSLFESGAGTRCLSSSRSSCCCGRHCPCPSTRLPAGRVRPCSRCRSSCTTGRCEGWRPGAPVTSSISACSSGHAAMSGTTSTGSSGSMRAACSSGAQARLPSRNAGSSTGRSSTDPGEVFSLPAWSLIALACRGHGPDSPYLRRGFRAGTGSSSTTATGSGRCASRLSGTAASRCWGLPSRVLERTSQLSPARCAGSSTRR